MDAERNEKMNELKKLDSVKVGRGEVIGGICFCDCCDDTWGLDDEDEYDDTPYWEKDCW